MTIFRRTARLLLALILLSGILNFSAVQTAWAGPGPPGHTHAAGEVEQEEILARSKAYLRRLVVNGKIDPSWDGMEPATIDQKDFKGRREWIITFDNPDVPDPGKRTLYMFFSLTGQVIAANFSGK